MKHFSYFLFTLSVLLITSFCNFDGYVLDQPNSNQKYGTAIEVSDDWYVVGSPSASSHGAIFIYRSTEDQTRGDLHSTFYASDVLSTLSSSYSIEFGISIALDGEWLLVGSPGAFSYGALIMFQYLPTLDQWNCTLVHEHDESATDYSQMGGEVTMRNGYLVSTVDGNDYVYVGRLLDGEWTILPHYIGSDLNMCGNEGILWYSPRPRLWDNLLAIGLPCATYKYSCAGGVAMFDLSDPEVDWWNYKKPDACLYPTDPVDTGNFGLALSLDLDHNRIAVGEPGYNVLVDESTSVKNAGKVSIFQHVIDPDTGEGEWKLEKLIVAETPITGSYLGSAVSLSRNYLLASTSPDSEDTDKCSVSLYNQITGWSPWAVYEGYPDQAAQFDNGDIVIVNDGTTVLLGAPSLTLVNRFDHTLNSDVTLPGGIYSYTLPQTVLPLTLVPEVEAPFTLPMEPFVMTVRLRDSLSTQVFSGYDLSIFMEVGWDGVLHTVEHTAVLDADTGTYSIPMVSPASIGDHTLDITVSMRGQVVSLSVDTYVPLPRAHVSLEDSDVSKKQHVQATVSIYDEAGDFCSTDLSSLIGICWRDEDDEDGKKTECQDATLVFDPLGFFYTAEVVCPSSSGVHLLEVQWITGDDMGDTSVKVWFANGVFSFMVIVGLVVLALVVIVMVVSISLCRNKKRLKELIPLLPTEYSRRE
eukprot:gnl/Dysnectes_brevis/4437_a5966_543.p1 GENE.gnl/Dysnectes_brevis/4437_a5966_543~~gnl/Dysnectes_brevis/4437_a5966_543.p1  ORF type:complete len:695 (+),score=212.81 gnl/Dysnectes_brevis/4437_a5966_543:39-2123(+)